MAYDAFTFWLVAAAMVGIALAFVLPRLITGGRRGERVSRARLNADVYRGEIAELEAERAAGTLSANDYARARTELERRLLEEATADEAPPAARGPRVVALLVALALPIVAFALYFVVGAPAMLAPPAEPDAATASPDYRSRLLAHLADAPRDGRALVALARLEMSEDRFAASAEAFAQAIAASPKIAGDPDVLCEYADALGMARGGQLAGEPARIIARALSLAPMHAKALEMAGSAAYERRDYRLAAQHWRMLLAQLTPGTSTHAELAAAVDRAERRAATMLPSGPDTSGMRDAPTLPARQRNG